MSGELPKIQSKSLFNTYVDKKNAEIEAMKIKNRIEQLRQEHDKILKKIQAEDQKAESIYRHRLELQFKKEEKQRQKVEAPPPFSLSVSRAQRETLKKVKEDMLLKKKTEVKEFRDWHRNDLKETRLQKSMDHETYRMKVIQGKEEERQANMSALAKLKERRNNIRMEMELEKDRVLREKYNYDQMIQELEQLEQQEITSLQHTQQRQYQTKEKVNLAQSLPPKEFEKKFGLGSTRNNYNSTSS